MSEGERFEREGEGKILINPKNFGFSYRDSSVEGGKSKEETKKRGGRVHMGLENPTQEGKHEKEMRKGSTGGLNKQNVARRSLLETTGEIRGKSQRLWRGSRKENQGKKLAEPEPSRVHAVREFAGTLGYKRYEAEENQPAIIAHAKKTKA